MLVYSLAIIPLLQRREKVRPIARRLEAAIPPNEVLYAVDPEYQPYLFYLRRPIDYVSRGERSAARRALHPRPAGERKGAEQSPLWLPQHAQPILRIKDYRGRRVILLRVAEGIYRSAIDKDALTDSLA